MSGRPFVLLGINTDENREAIKAVINKQNLTWRSWWDGGSTEGPIVTQWQIENWPTLYLLDEKGVIKHIADEGGGIEIEPLEAAVEQLVKAAESKATPTKKAPSVP